MLLTQHLCMVAGLTSCAQFQTSAIYKPPWKMRSIRSSSAHSQADLPARTWRGRFLPCQQIRPYATCSDHIFQSSTRLTTPLVDLIVSQQLSRGSNLETMLSTKKEIRQLARLSAIQQASNLDGVMDPHQKRLITLGKEKGSSTWLTSLPIEEHGFHLS